MFFLLFISIYVFIYDVIKGCELQKILYFFINEYDVYNFYKNFEKLLYLWCVLIVVFVSDGFYFISFSYFNKVSEVFNVYFND